MKVWPFSGGGKDRISCCLPILHNISLYLRHPVIESSDKLLLCPLHDISVLAISIIVCGSTKFPSTILFYTKKAFLSYHHLNGGLVALLSASQEHFRLHHMFSACIS